MTKKQIKSKKVGEIIPHLMEDNLIIPLKAKWIEVFGKIPKFEVRIHDERLVIQSQKIPKRDGFRVKYRESSL